MAVVAVVAVVAMVLEVFIQFDTMFLAHIKICINYKKKSRFTAKKEIRIISGGSGGCCSGYSSVAGRGGGKLLFMHPKHPNFEQNLVISLLFRR